MARRPSNGVAGQRAGLDIGWITGVPSAMKTSLAPLPAWACSLLLNQAAQLLWLWDWARYFAFSGDGRPHRRALHNMESQNAGWREMHVKAWVPRQPSLRLGVLVGGLRRFGLGENDYPRYWGGSICAASSHAGASCSDGTGRTRQVHANSAGTGARLLPVFLTRCERRNVCQQGRCRYGHQPHGHQPQGPSARVIHLGLKSATRRSGVPPGGRALWTIHGNSGNYARAISAPLGPVGIPLGRVVVSERCRERGYRTSSVPAGHAAERGGKQTGGRWTTSSRRACTQRCASACAHAGNGGEPLPPERRASGLQRR